MPKKHIIIDSNLLIDYYTLMSSHQKKQAIRKYLTGTILINDVTIGETTNILKNKKNYYTAYLATNDLLQRPNFILVSIDAKTRALAMELLKKYKDLGLAYNDCLILAQSILLDIPILTEDEAMWTVQEASFEYL